MSAMRPLVSIGMPVYNAGEYIRQSLQSLLAQDYDNFELIISDNASSDCTPEICQEYAAKDSRIRFFSNAENLGAVANFGIAFSMGVGPYFMWAAGDDLWKPGFISELVGLLEANPSAVLAGCRAEKIDYDGLILKLGPRFLTTTGMTRAERLRYFARHNTSWLFYGLYRIEILRAAFTILEDSRLLKFAGDVLFTRKCIDSGDLVFTEKVLFSKRQSSISSHAEVDFSGVAEMSWGVFRHCYVAFFKCYRLGGLTPREAALIWAASIQGLGELSFYRRAKSILRGFCPDWLVKAKSALAAARPHRRQ